MVRSIKAKSHSRKRKSKSVRKSSSIRRRTPKFVVGRPYKIHDTIEQRFYTSHILSFKNGILEFEDPDTDEFSIERHVDKLGNLYSLVFKNWIVGKISKV